MIIILYGPDDYRRETRRKFYAAEFTKKYPQSSATQFDFAEPENIPNFVNYVSHNSLFESKRVMTIRNFEEGEAEFKKAAPLVETGSANCIVVSSERKPSPAVFRKANTAERFDFLEGPEWEKFIKDEAARLGFKLSAEAVKILARAFLKDTWGLATELAVLSSAGKPTVSADDLAKFELELAPDFWGALMKFRNGSQTQKLAALEMLLADSEPGAKIFNILASHAMEIHPILAAYDLAIKSGKLDYEEALLDFAIR